MFQQCDAQIIKDNAYGWPYCPSPVAAVLFSILFGITFLWHFYQVIKYSQLNALVITIGAALETVAYILRTACAHKLSLDTPNRAQFALVLISPLWMNAYDFLLLGRLVNFCLPDRQLCGIRARRLGMTFVGLDIITFLIQLGGAAMALSNEQNTADNGLHVYTAGVAIQFACICVFCYYAYNFQKRLSIEVEPVDPVKAGRVRKLLKVLYLSLSLISFRIIFRVIEYAGDNQSTISQTIGGHEYFLWIFDSVPMFLALLVFNLMHPATVINGPSAQWKKYTKEEKLQMKQEKKAAKEEKKAAKATATRL